MDFDSGLDFTRAEVAEALLAYAKIRGASGPSNAADIEVFTLGSRNREGGYFLRARTKAKSQ